MKRLVLALSTLAGAALAIASCGGIGGTDDLFALGNGGAAPTGSSSSSSGSGGGATSSSSSSSSTTSSSTSTTSSSSSTTTSSSSSTTTSSSSSTTSSSSSGTADPQVPCAGALCNAFEVCCYDQFQKQGSCDQSGNCPGDQVEIACNGPEDCPLNQVCCADADFQMQPPYVAIYCQDTCDPQSQLIICGEHPELCTAGTTCKASTVLGPGYNVCY